MIYQYSVQQLNKKSKNMVVWCMGCGKKFHEMIQRYSNELFVKKIEKILDSNSQLSGKEKIIGQKRLKISGLEVFMNDISDPILLIITSDHYQEIYSSIEKYIKNKCVICTCYPIIYYNYSKYIMKLFSLLPLKKRQLLFRAGNEPHENADAIKQYLEKEYHSEPYQIIYLEDEIKEQNNRQVIYLNYNTLKEKTSILNILRYCYFYARSSVLFYENESILKVRKKQILIYLNHGMIPLKYVADVLRQPEQLDYSICPSSKCSYFYTTQYGISENKLIYIMPPRVCSIFCADKYKVDKILETKDRGLILWLPTFRQLIDTERQDSLECNPLCLMNDEAVLKDVDRKLKINNQKLIIKLHPREKKISFSFKNYRNIVLITDEMLHKNNLSIQDVLGRANALISDYSSVTFEYMLTGNMIGYAISDIERYNRGFSVEDPLSYMPGKKIKSIDELMCFFDEVKYQIDEFSEDRKQLLYRLFGNIDPQGGSRDLIKFIETILYKG